MLEETSPRLFTNLQKAIHVFIGTCLPFLFVLFISLHSMAQFEYIDQSELYSKHKITTVRGFFHIDQTRENDELWRIDSKGRVVSHELLSTGNDTTISKTEWSFENDRMVLQEKIGIWNTLTYSLDTSLTEYFYNNSNQLIRSQNTHTRNQDTLITDYLYSDQVMQKTLYNPHQLWWDQIESIEFYKSKYPKKKTTFLCMDESTPFKKEVYFDELGAVQVEIEYNQEINHYIPTKIKNFIYEKGKLIRTKQVYFHNLINTGISTSEVTYHYNKLGLLQQQTSLGNGTITSYNSFEYE